MRTTPVGASGLPISAITLGTMTFGTPVAEPEAVGLVHHARDLGITSIDVANMYEGYARVAGSSGGVAEEIVGRAVAHDRDAYVVATKLGMKVGEGPDDEFTSPSAIRVQLRASLRRLGMEHVDLYYLHKPDPVSAPEEIVAAIQAEVDGGLVREWGVSNYGAPELRVLLDAVAAVGARPPAVCQPKLNLLVTDALDELVPLCVENGIAVLAYQVLEGGLLTGKYRADAVPAGTRGAEKPEWMSRLDEAGWSRLAQIGREADSAGRTMTQHAIAEVLGMPGVVSALVGVTRAGQLDEAAGAVA